MVTKLASTYKSGDFVRIVNEDDMSTRIGKIEEIFEESGDKLFRYNLYLTQSSIPTKESYFGTDEIFQTEDTEKEYYSNIKERIDVLKFELYIRKKKLIPNSNLLYFRQKYISERDLLLPELDPCCCCDEILNPDLEFSVCNGCKKFIHGKCIMLQNLSRCPECSINLELSDPVQTNDFIKKKRSTDIKQEHVSAINSTKNLEKIVNKSIPNPQQVQQPAAQIFEEFGNLPLENRQYLTSLKNKIKGRNLIAQKTMTQDEKSRKIAKDQIINTLVRINI